MSGRQTLQAIIPNGVISMVLEMRLSDALDCIEESRCGRISSSRLQDAILNAAAIVTKIKDLKNGYNGATNAQSDPSSETARPADLGAADLPGVAGPE